MNIAVVEDDSAQNRALCQMAGELSGEGAQIFPFLSGGDFLFRYRPGFFDLLLLDIQMPGDDGLRVAREVRRSGDGVMLIFVTALSDYVFEGYDVGAAQYLLKPVDRRKLKDCIDRAKRRTEETEKLYFPTPDGVRIFGAREILYLEASAHQTEVVTGTGRFVCREAFGEAVKHLPRDFACPHRCYCVNLLHVWQLQKQELVLVSGARIPISRRRYAAFAEAFLQYARREL